MHRFLIRQSCGFKLENIIASTNASQSSQLLLALNTSIKRATLLNYNCWSCDRHLTDAESKAFFCPCSQAKILPLSTYKAGDERNYFELFGLKTDYQIDRQELRKRFRQLMRKLHPDLFAQKEQVF